MFKAANEIFPWLSVSRRFRQFQTRSELDREPFVCVLQASTAAVLDWAGIRNYSFCPSNLTLTTLITLERAVWFLRRNYSFCPSNLALTTFNYSEMTCSAAVQFRKYKLRNTRRNGKRTSRLKPTGILPQRVRNRSWVARLVFHNFTMVKKYLFKSRNSLFASWNGWEWLAEATELHNKARAVPSSSASAKRSLQLPLFQTTFVLGALYIKRIDKSTK